MKLFKFKINACIHHSPLVKWTAIGRNLKMHYLPQYCPKQKPIELLFGAIKRKLKSKIDCKGWNFNTSEGKEDIVNILTKIQKESVIKPYFYGFSKTLKVSFPRDQLWSRGKKTLFQYRSKVYLYRQYLYGTETKFFFLEIKVGPEEKKLLRFLKNRKNTVLNIAGDYQRS